jgi:uncharacterized membrane protein HdeD (DUF308 family)
MVEGLVVALLVFGIYVALGAIIALVAYIDARRANPDARWHAGQWVMAIGLGPPTILMLLLQRIIPDPPERPQP